MSETVNRIDDRELMLWALIYDGARWEHPTKVFCFRGIRYSCEMDAIGLPDIPKLLQGKIREAFDVWIGWKTADGAG